MASDPILGEIEQAIGGGRLVPVVGAGVSSATAPMPSWRALVESAIAHAKASGSGDPQPAAEALARNNLAEAAELATTALGVEFPAWLRSSFHVQRSQITSRAVIDRISDLMPSFVATTNYDRLLTMLHPERWEPVTWTDPVGMQTVLRDGGRILHLHGVYDQPKSVIFSAASYRTLTSDAAYETVGRSLWLEYTLLFVGASVDGVSDPDFARLLGWMSGTFGPSPFKHYALMRTGSFSSEQQRDFLNRFRLQLVPFGSEFSDLPRMLDELNSNRAKARAWRQKLLMELRAGGSGDKSADFANVIEGVRSGAGDLRGAAEELFQKRQRTSAYLRGQLAALQKIMSALVDVEEVRRQINLWETGEITAYEGDFRAAVRDANSALMLVPEDLLAALKRRNVDVHGVVLSGHAASVMDRYERSAERNRNLAPDPYGIENLKRILSTTEVILDAKPETVFPEVANAVIHSAYRGPRLLVTRTNRLELRKLSDPAEVVAVLPLPEDRSRESELVKLRGGRTILTLDRNGLLAWQPEAGDEPCDELLVDEAYGVDGMASRSTPDGLETFVVTIGGPAYELRDLKLLRKWQPLPDDAIWGPLVTPDGRLFAFAASQRFQLLEARPGQVARPRISNADLHAVFGNLPGLSKFWGQRLQEEQEKLKADEFEPDLTVSELFVAHSLSWSYLGMLALEVQIGFLAHDESAVLLLDAQTLSPAGYAYVEDQVISDLVIVEGSDGSPLIFVTLLSDFQLSYDLVRWFRGVRTKQGWIFVPAGSTLRTRDDLVELCMVNASEGFAADDSGGLFHFSVKTGEYLEVARDKTSKISGLAVLEG
jgi:hypothetical protein